MEMLKNFLVEIYKGAKMGVDSIALLLPKCENEMLSCELKKQKKEYQLICIDVEKYMNELGIDSKEPPIMAQAGAWMDIQISTLFDKSASHIAEKLMLGNLMGIIGITKILNRYNGKLGNNNLKYSERFIDLCEQNMKNLKTYLK